MSSRHLFPRLLGAFLLLQVLAPLHSSAQTALYAPAARSTALRGTTGLPTLTNLQQVRDLVPSEAARAYPVKLRAVVTYVDAAVPRLFVQDAANGVYVVTHFGQFPQPLMVGQLVELTGTTTPGQFAPSIDYVHIRVVGTAPLPTPRRLPFDQYLQGQHECQWVELDGVVQSGEEAHGQLLLNVETPGGKLFVYLPQFPPDWERSLVRSTVRLTGVIAAIFNGHRQALGVRMFVPGGHLEILERAPEDPFALPISPLGSVGGIQSQETVLHAIRVRATLTAIEPGAAYVSDGAQSLEVQASTLCNASPGDLLDVVGFPASIESRPALDNAICRVTGKSLGIEPAPVKPDDILLPSALKDAPNYPFSTDSRYDMRLVTIEGTLFQSSQGPQGTTLTLGSDRRLFGATLPPLGGDVAKPLKPGSLVQLTGLCIVSFNQFRQGEGFRILLRGPADIVVLGRPPWWNLRHSIWIGSLAAGFLLGAMLWIAVLHRQVDIQTGQLKRANAALQRLSDRDGLTGIMNRRKFDETLDIEFLRARRASTQLSLVMIDIDSFKSLNDHFGHQRGDECLVEVVEALLSVPLRTEDLVARYGGEEFAVILPGTDHSGALEVAERLRNSVRQRAIPHPLSPFDQTLSISLGVATIRPPVGDEPALLIHLADRALYASKMAGRNRITSMYDMPQQAEREMRSH